MLSHKEVTTTVTDTDRGEFSALAATYSRDRANEQIRKGAFATTLAKWQATGRQIPVHWAHKGEAANVIGGIDPAKARETDAGLLVEGTLDLEDSEVAREAWRSMKRNRVALSFGYLVNRSRKLGDGGLELIGFDLFEVSIVPDPCNEDTRILSLKSAEIIAVREGEELLAVFRGLERRQKAGEFTTSRDVEAKASTPAAKSTAPIVVETFEC